MNHQPKGVRLGGRKKGTPNKASGEVREVARRLVGDPIYLANLKIRLEQGAAGPIESTLWFYAWGKPIERHGGETEGEPIKHVMEHHYQDKP